MVYQLNKLLILTIFLALIPGRLMAQTTQNCDSAIIPLYETSKTNQNYINSWLQMITKDTYSIAKSNASGSALLASGGMFDANYDSFSQKRSQYLKKSEGHLEYQDAREAFKTYLTPEQLKAWTQCKSGKKEPAASYKNVDKDAATILFTWEQPGDVGILKNVSFELMGATVSDQMTSTKTLNGTKSFILLRSEGGPIRGVMKGVYGVNDTDVSADFYIPAYVEPKEVEYIPTKVVQKLDGKLLTATAHFKNKHNRTVDVEFKCLEVPANTDLIITNKVYENKHQFRPTCVKGRQYCNGHNEWCTQVKITSGCTVNKEWHEWYKKQSALNNLPMSNEAICKEDVKKIASN